MSRRNVFFHLEEYDDALRLAMAAGTYFDVQCKSQYVETLIATCIDQYIVLRTTATSAMSTIKMDQRMETIVERMFERCYLDGMYSQALGIALESRRLDKVQEIFSKSTDLPNLLSYCFDICRSILSNRDFRLKVLEEMVVMYKSLENPDYNNTCQCLQMLNEDAQVAVILEKLVRSNNTDDTLIAYQIAFDLYENENQRFLIAVNGGLPTLPILSPPIEGEESKEETITATTTVAASAVATTITTTPSPPVGAHPDYWPRISKLRSILSGSFSSDLMLDFLFRSSNTDMLLMKSIKTAAENRNSVLHNAAVVTHAYLNAGTTVDSFLREHLDWMGRAANWAKFTATASLGVVHKGHGKVSMNLLQPYLPNGGVSTSSYSEGGALYALGLIHANGGGADEISLERITYLRTALRNAGTDEIVQHGACLGIGLAAMASHDFSLYEELKNIMFTDSAVAGEAATLAIGLTLCGAGSASEPMSSIVTELFAYAHDTKHEKIIRGAVLAIALIMYGQEEGADGLIEQMIRDKDPVIRYGAMYTLAMAYCGTANNVAIKRLLHVAVSDVSDDVRRAAVTCLGFLLFRTPVQVPKLVSLLAESFNPHVRYGSCLAIGIACAGTGKNEAMQLLEPMMDDPVDYVRQGAMMSVAMVMMQESQGKNPKVKVIREKFLKIINDKHQSVMTKMGAILAQGILDAGGRNAVISLQSRTGFAKMSAAVGIVIWAQHWFWYPLMHFVELALQPTALVGLNINLMLPTCFSVKCDAKESLFAYAKHMEEKKEEKKELVATAILSTTAKAKARRAQVKNIGSTATVTVLTEEKKTNDAMDLAVIVHEDKGDGTLVEEVAAENKKKDNDKKTVTFANGGGVSTSSENVKTEEPLFFQLKNPARVTKSQESFLNYDLTQRYIPVISQRVGAGVIMLKDMKPGDVEDVKEVQAPTPLVEEEEEANPPEPFEWEPPMSSATTTSATTSS